MYDSCDECPCLEEKDDKSFCFWYQGWCNTDQPCGNHFKTRPEKTQEQLEDQVFGRGE